VAQRSIQRSYISFLVLTPLREIHPLEVQSIARKCAFCSNSAHNQRFAEVACASLAIAPAATNISRPRSPRAHKSLTMV